jgi:HEPN domain-containing protein
MQFTAEHYYRAACERIADARVLYDKGRHGLCLYVSGLAVECLLRAFVWKKSRVFDGRHDLMKLLRESGVLRLQIARLERQGLEPEQIQQTVVDFHTACETVIRLWENDYRFADESQIRGRLRDAGQLVGVKGDAVKANARRTWSAAMKVIETGRVLWTSGKK